MVAVDWDSCYADGACIEACPVQVFQWYRTEQDIPAIEMANTTSAGRGEDHEREDAWILLTNQVLFENMIAFGVWLAYLFVLLKRSRLIKATLNIMRNLQERLMKNYQKVVNLRHTRIKNVQTMIVALQEGITATSERLNMI
jgi:ferredoxin